VADVAVVLGAVAVTPMLALLALMPEAAAVEVEAASLLVTRVVVVAVLHWTVLQAALLCSWKLRRRNSAMIFPSEVEGEEQLVHCHASSLSHENCPETAGMGEWELSLV